MSERLYLQRWKAPHDERVNSSRIGARVSALQGDRTTVKSVPQAWVQIQDVLEVVKRLSGKEKHHSGFRGRGTPDPRCSCEKFVWKITENINSEINGN